MEHDIFFYSSVSYLCLSDRNSRNNKTTHFSGLFGWWRVLRFINYSECCKKKLWSSASTRARPQAMPHVTILGAQGRCEWHVTSMRNTEIAVLKQHVQSRFRSTLELYLARQANFLSMCLLQAKTGRKPILVPAVEAYPGSTGLHGSVPAGG